MVKRRRIGVWVFRGYEVLLALCIVAGFLSGPAMPRSTVLIGRIGLGIFVGPWLAIQLCELYARVTLRKAYRRFFDAMAIEARDPCTYAPTDVARATLATCRAAAEITSEATDLGAVVLGDLEKVGGRPYVAEVCATIEPRIARVLSEELLAARKRSGYEPQDDGSEVVKPEYRGRSAHER